MNIDQNLQNFFNIGFNDIKIIDNYIYEHITNTADLYKFIDNLPNSMRPLLCHIEINTDLNEFNKFIASLANIIEEYHIVNKTIKINIYFKNLEFLLQHKCNLMENKIAFLMKWRDTYMISSNGFSYLEKSEIYENIVKINTILKTNGCEMIFREEIKNDKKYYSNILRLIEDDENKYGKNLSNEKEKLKIFQTDKNVKPWQDFTEIRIDNLSKLKFSDYKTMAEIQLADLNSKILPDDIITEIYKFMLPSWTSLDEINSRITPNKYLSERENLLGITKCDSRQPQPSFNNHICTEPDIVYHLDNISYSKKEKIDQIDNRYNLLRELTNDNFSNDYNRFVLEIYRFKYDKTHSKVYNFIYNIFIEIKKLFINS